MHIPVLLDEVIEALAPKPNQDFIDATVGLGGHAEAILQENAPGGRLLGIDRDVGALERAREQLAHLGKRVVLAQGSFSDLAVLARQHGFSSVSGILFDLGFSSLTLVSGRGFTFQNDEPLDMRYDTAQSLTAAAVINSWTKDELIRIFRLYGDERRAFHFAEAIVAARRRKRILTTGDLLEITGIQKKSRLHPATKLFQALRIAVNNEYEAISVGLSQAWHLLAIGGRLVVISFHSGEDRIVKQQFRKFADVRLAKLPFKKPKQPSATEVRRNPRSRSAKLRVLEKIK